jgi:hypothetical protein
LETGRSAPDQFRTAGAKRAESAAFIRAVGAKRAESVSKNQLRRDQQALGAIGGLTSSRSTP